MSHHLVKFISVRDSGEVSWVCTCGVTGVARDRTGAHKQFTAHVEEFVG